MFNKVFYCNNINCSSHPLNSVNGREYLELPYDSCYLWPRQIFIFSIPIKGDASDYDRQS